MCTTFASNYSSNNTQLETSSNPMHQVTMLERQTLSYVGNCSTVIPNALFQSDGIKIYDSNCDEVPTAQENFMENISSCDSEVLSKEINTLKETLSNNVKEKESLSKTLTVFKTESKEKESKYIDKEIVLEKQNKELENIIFKMHRSTQAMHMLTKPQVFYDDTHKQALGYQNPFYLKKAQRIKPTLYDGSVIAKEHAMISLNNQKEDFGKRFVTQQKLSAEQAFWLKHSNYNPDTSVKSHTPVRNESPSELPKCSVDKNTFKIEKKELKLENERLLEHIICQDVVNIVMHADVKFDNVLPMPNTFLDDNIALDIMKMENDRLMELLVSQDLVHTVVNSLAVINDYQSMEISYIKQYEKNLKLAAELSQMNELSKTCSKLEQRNYIRITKENIDTLRDIVEQARISNHLDNALAYAFMYMKQIQELLVYVSDTCPDSLLKSEKVVAVTPMNKARNVTFAKISATLENNTQTRVDLHKTQTTNRPLVPSTSVHSSTNASGSIPRSTIKNTRIMRPLISNQKYQSVEAHTRNAKPSLNKENSLSRSVCSTCKKCLFDSNHDLCVVNYLSDVNACARAKSVKSIKKNEWKPIGKMFTNVGYKWVPTRRTFTLVGNNCPLTRFTSTKIVPPRKPIKSNVIKNIKPSSATQWRPRETKHVSSSSEPRIAEARTTNHLEPNKNKGSNVSISPCSYSVQCSSGLAPQGHMASADNSSGLAPHRK
ncbi:hypothetical protein Tco_0875980 [Tanacetum coccineum]|uniref:Uncharacterized protein n=1 Tax=Tanacetum coccineum TaxID=301880 RepID=A0ABQ5BWN1_9ASTR